VILGKKGDNAQEQFTQKTGVPVYSIAKIREVIDYLFEEKISVQVEGVWQPISLSLKKSFEEYLEEYGT
jgi:orotate phosphoribosyltransferase